MGDQIEVIIDLGKSINDTEKLNNGSIRPKNIICVIYNNKNLFKKNYKNLKFFYTHKRPSFTKIDCI